MKGSCDSKGESLWARGNIAVQHRGNIVGQHWGQHLGARGALEAQSVTRFLRMPLKPLNPWRTIGKATPRSLERKPFKISGVTSGVTTVAEGCSSPVMRHRTSSVRTSTLSLRRSSLRRRLRSAPEGAEEGTAAVGGTGKKGPAPGVAGGSGEEDAARRSRMYFSYLRTAPVAF